MDREEAIELLDQQTQAEALKKYGGGWIGVNAMNNALQIAIAALRAQHGPVKLDRSRWEGCEYCKSVPDEDADIIPGKYNHKICIKISYCPFCGLSLTEKAWEELEKRIQT